MVRMATHHDYYKDKGEYGNQTNYIRRTHTGKIQLCCIFCGKV